MAQSSGGGGCKYYARTQVEAQTESCKNLNFCVIKPIFCITSHKKILRKHTKNIVKNMRRHKIFAQCIVCFFMKILCGFYSENCIYCKKKSGLRQTIFCVDNARNDEIRAERIVLKYTIFHVIWYFLCRFSDLFRLCPQYVMLPPVTEHVSLHSKSLCKNIARASGGCK